MSRQRHRPSALSDSERCAAAHKFFWDMVGDQIFTAEEATRHIRALAKCLPPFTPIRGRDEVDIELLAKALAS